MKRYLTIGTFSVLAAATLFTGCGGGSSSNDSTTNNTTLQNGYFIDSPVAGIAYETASGIKGITDSNGKFQYKTQERVKFAIGKLDLGEVTPPADGLVTPQALANGNQTVETTMLRLIQALDEDNNPANGITIPQYIIDALNTIPGEINITNLTDDTQILNLNTTLAEAIDENYDGVIDVTALQAQTHFENSLQLWQNGIRPDTNTTQNQGNTNTQGNGTAYGQGNGQANQQGGLTTAPGAMVDLTQYPLATLTDAQKYSLAYMWNEEKLAKDIYLALNEVYPVTQFYNIATRSETVHEASVEALVQRYDINITNLADYTVNYSEEELRALAPGQYGIDTIQNLYNILYEKGIQSQTDALQVGCMVEVTDINDLNEYIQTAQEANATDLVVVFENLRAGSYNHYWAFDNALKAVGVSEGCASAGAEYAKTPEEYPTHFH